MGVFDDTGFLEHARPRTIQTAVDLLQEVGERANEIPDLVAVEPASGEQRARTIGTLRVSGYRAGDLTVAVTEIGGREGTTVNTRCDTGVGLAVVCNPQPHGIRVTARASETVAERVNLVDALLPALAAEFGGDAGGHSGAGVAHLDSGDTAAVEQAVIEWLEQELGVTFGEIA